MRQSCVDVGHDSRESSRRSLWSDLTDCMHWNRFYLEDIAHDVVQRHVSGFLGNMAEVHL